MNIDKRVEEYLIQTILGSESFQNGMRQDGNRDEEARNGAVEIVKMDFIEGNWITLANAVQQVRPNALVDPHRRRCASGS